MINLSGGRTLYTEVYSLVGIGGDFPVNATINYKNSGPENWGTLDIPAFITPDGEISIPAYQFESSPTFSDFSVVKEEIFIVAQNYFNNQGLISPSFILKNTTKPQIDPNPTPQQITEQTQQETVKKEEQQTVTEITQTNPKITTQNTPPDLQAQGADKLAIVLNKKRSSIKRTLIPIAISIATQLGIKYIGTPQLKLPEICLPQDELNKLILKRNALVNKLNNIVKITDTLTKTLTGVSLALTVLVSLVKKIKSIRKAASIAVKFIPSPPGTPGIITSTLTDLKDTQETLIEKLSKASGVIASATLAISTLNAVLLKLITILNSIDVILKKCNTNQVLELTPLSPTLLQLEQINNEVQQNNNEETYNGFVLEIVEEPYSPTVNRRKAVAKNKDGIILISTPLSFTTLNQVLIEELKLIIDANNLRAD